MPYSTRPNAVSRYLSEAGHQRSIGYSQGYTVRSNAAGDILVRFYVGGTNLSLNPEQRRELTRKKINALERTLSKRYKVIMFEPDEGSNYRLTVRPQEA